MTATAQGTAAVPAAAFGASDCEAVSSGLLAQPVAALSSLAFVLAAGSLLAHWRRRGGPVPAVAWAYAGALAAVGLGSLDYHGLQTPAAGLLHDVPVVAVVALGLAVPAVRRARGQQALGHGTRDAVVAAGVLAGLAATAVVLGRTGSPLCDPASLLQPHAAWHVLAAAGLTAWALALWPVDHVLYRSRYWTTCMHLSKHPDASSSDEGVPDQAGRGRAAARLR